MGRFPSIAAKKDKTAAQKTKVYTRFGKVITMAAQVESDPDLNPDLANAIRKAKQNDVPADVIERAIKRGSGELEGVSYTTQFYEGYGPGGVALYIKTLTDNTNRTSNEVRVIFQKYFGAIGEPGSVARQFAPKGVIMVSGRLRREERGNKTIEHIEALDVEEFELEAIELGAQDIDREGDLVIITTSREDYIRIDEAISKSYNVEQSDIEYLCDNLIALSPQDSANLAILVENLEDHDDVERVWTNLK